MTLKKWLSAILLGSAAILFICTRGSSINSWPLQTPQMPLTQIIFFGDSLTNGYGLKNKELSFPNRIADQLDIPHSILGFNGYTTKDAITKLELIKQRPPSLVIVTLGGNDILKKIKLQETQSNLKTIFRQLQDWGHIVVFTEVLSIMDNPRHKMHIALCSELGIPMIPNILRGLHLDDGMMPDSIHPNEHGCQKISERIIQALNEVVYTKLMHKP